MLQRNIKKKFNNPKATATLSLLSGLVRSETHFSDISKRLIREQIISSLKMFPPSIKSIQNIAATGRVAGGFLV
jgi:hypothetical protein